MLKLAHLNSERNQAPSQDQLRIHLEIGIRSDPGRVRRDAPNEDVALALVRENVIAGGPQPVGLFVVADGMGGHTNGQEASHVAVQAIREIVTMRFPAEQVEGEDKRWTRLLEEGVQHANQAIYERNRHTQDSHGKMGTTLTAALVIGDKASVVNVGDSRVYLYRQGDGLTQITRDHSVVARLVEVGAITQEEIYTHPKRNQIYRCLGDHPSVQVDCFEVTLQPGDALLLCSDGLWEMVRDPDSEKIMRSSLPHATQAAALLLQAALCRGGADNVSVIVVAIQTV